MIQEVLDEVRRLVRKYYTVPEGKRSLTFVDNAPDPAGGEEYMMGIYLASPSGEVFTFDAESDSFHCTVCFDCVLSDNIKISGEEVPYMDALIRLVRKHDFAVSNDDMFAVSSRVDNGYPYNGFVLALDLTTGYAADGLN